MAEHDPIYLGTPEAITEAKRQQADFAQYAAATILIGEDPDNPNELMIDCQINPGRPTCIGEIGRALHDLSHRLLQHHAENPCGSGPASADGSGK